MIKKLLSVHFFFLIIIISADPQSNSLRTINYNDSAAFDAYILDNMKHPGVAGCVVKNNEVIFSRCYGYADIERNIPVTDSTLFRLASVSKPFTATALMQLWEDGLFHLDDNINDYLSNDLQVSNPKFPNEKITFRHLLSHTSSINNEFNFITWLISIGEDSPISIESFLHNFFNPEGLYYSKPFYDWAPGTHYNYSTIGYTLIAYLVEQLSNTSFEEYCQEHIFIPLEMNETSWFFSNLDTNNIAVQYQGNNRIGHVHTPFYPSGNLKTSSSQLAKFIKAFLNYGIHDGVRILDSSTIDLMNTIQYPDLAQDRGLAWYHYNYPSLITNFYNVPEYCKYFEHAGHSSNGASTRLGCFQTSKDNIGVFVLANGDDLDYLYIWEEMWKYAILHDMAYPYNVSLNNSFFNTKNDTVIIKTRMVNPHDHEIIVHAIYTGLDSAVVDSVRLYDDGIHYDELKNDGVWGNSVSNLYNTDDFILNISTLDTETGNYLVLYDLACFTSKGPILFEKYDGRYDDRLPVPGKKYDFYLSLRNMGSTDVTDIEVNLISLDELATFMYPSSTFGNILANDYSASDRPFSVKISELVEPGTMIPIKMDIYKLTNNTNNYYPYQNKYNLLTDTFYIDVAEPQVSISNYIEPIITIYPNPVNDILNIEVSNLNNNETLIEIYDVLGKMQCKKGKHNFSTGSLMKIDLSSYPKGFYLVRVRTKNISKTMKVIVK